MFLTRTLGYMLIGAVLLWGQQVKIVNLKQLPLPETKKNYRNVKLSPDGKYLSFEMMEKESIHLYLYDLQKELAVKLGKESRTKKSDDLFDIIDVQTLGKNEVTNQLSWFYRRDKKRIYFDFIHSPRRGIFQLYRGFLRSGRDNLRRFANQPIDNSRMFEKYQGLENFSLISYPSYGHTLLRKKLPKVVLTIDKDLYLFAHQPYDPPTKITSPGLLYADIVGKFSPDDRSIVFSREGGDRCNIFRVDWTPEGGWGEPYPIVQSSGIDISPEWSADGSKIAYYSDEGHPRVFSIWLYDVATGKTRELIKNVRRNNDRHKGPNWVDSRGLLYLKISLSNRTPIMYYDLQTGQEIMLNTNTASNEDLDVLPRDNGEYLVAFTSRGDINTGDDLIWTKVYLMTIKIQP